MRSARGGRQGGLEPGAGRQAADHRGPEVRQLLQGDLPRQRHQGRADLSGSARRTRSDWFLTNEMKIDAREQGQQGSRLAGACSRTRSSRPGMPGWLDDGRRARSRSSSPTRSRATRSATTPTSTSRKHPWRMDDEKLMYPFYEKLVKASKTPGLKNVCVHKGLFPPSVDAAVPAPARLLPTCATSARRRRTGRSSTSSSTTRPIAHRRRRHGGRRLGAVRADRARRLGDRPRRDPGEVRRHQRLRRPRPDLRAEHRGRAAAVRGA